MAVQTAPAPRPATPESPHLPKIARKDAWWIGPLWFFVLFSAFVVWTTFRTFQNAYYDTDYGFKHHLSPYYLSPFYSPTIVVGWTVLGYHISPAIWILIFPLSFRLSCYYYRKAIYRSYLADPLACAVTEPAPLEKSRFKRYMGERGFPLIAMNFHRYAFYAAVVFIIILWYDTVLAFLFPNSGGGVHFGIGIGSLVFLVNILLLTCYTFSCHSWRHLIGGTVNCYSCSLANQTRYGLWKKVTFLNERHGLWAMLSLISVGLTDVYVWLVASGRITDFHLLK